MNLPRINEVYEKDGLKRQVIGMNRRSDVPQDVDIFWKRPDKDREYIIWLPNWYRWVAKASLVT